MKAEFIAGDMINSDLGVVNAARTSLNKHHDTFIEPDDRKLIEFLAKNNHISPFFHGRLYFHMEMTDKERLYFYEYANLAGFQWIKTRYGDLYNYYLKGSIFGFIANLDAFPSTIYPRIAVHCLQKFPVSWEALLMALGNTRSWHGVPRNCMCMHEDDVEHQALDNPELYKLLSATIRIKLPIAMARQLRTSQVGFFYSDLYVEGESFAYNEVSRRYVNDDPEYYRVDKWRVREGSKVKQGSTGYASEDSSAFIIEEEDKVIENAVGMYRYGNGLSIAPEQLRILLPQNMYTEYFQTGSLHRFAQLIKLRTDIDVQQETRECAEMVRDCLKQQFPHWASVYNF